MCMIDGCDEFYVVYREPTATKARKEHKCDECRRTIAVGETYYRAAGLMAGDGWDQHHICSHCWVACEWLNVNCGGFLHHAVQEDIKEHADECRRFDLLMFAEKQRKQWKWKAGLRELPKLPRPIKLGDATPNVGNPFAWARPTN